MGRKDFFFYLLFCTSLLGFFVTSQHSRIPSFVISHSALFPFSPLPLMFPCSFLSFFFLYEYFSLPPLLPSAANSNLENKQEA